MPEIDPPRLDAQKLLHVIVKAIQSGRIRKNRPETFLTYGDALELLGRPKPWGHAGNLLRSIGLRSLNLWTAEHEELPKIAALIVNKGSRLPSSAFAESFGFPEGEESWKTWWMEEANRAIGYDWSPFLTPEPWSDLLPPVSSETRNVRSILHLLTILLLLFLPILLVFGLGKILSTSKHLPDAAWLIGMSTLIAFLTSSVLQILKDHGGLRSWVHKVALGRWLKGRLMVPHIYFLTDEEREWASMREPHDFPTEEELKRTSMQGRGERVQAARAQIEALCAAGAPGSRPFYDLSTGQFCGQIATAVDLVMIEPRAYIGFFAALTSGNDAEHLEEMRRFANIVYLDDPDLEGQEASHFRDDRDRLRARVINYSQRALDGLQIDTTRLWKLSLLLGGLLVSLGFSVALVMNIYPPDGLVPSLAFVYTAGVCTLAGALLAPLAYDITSAVRGFGRR